MTETRLRARDTFALAAFAALAAAALHVGVIAFRVVVSERMVGYSREFAWLAPLAYFVWVLPFAVLLAAIGAVAPRLGAAPVSHRWPTRCRR